MQLLALPSEAPEAIEKTRICRRTDRAAVFSAAKTAKTAGG